jgi:hypothetical protein
MPRASKLLRVEGIKIILYIEQAATELAGVRVFTRILAAPAGFLDTLEIGGRHGILKG